MSKAPNNMLSLKLSCQVRGKGHFHPLRPNNH